MVNVMTLDGKGVLLAVVFGAAILLLGRNYGLLFLADLLAFLIFSAVVTRAGRHRKEGIGMYEHARGWKNVLANGLVPVIIAGIYLVNSYANLVSPLLIVFAYIASASAITSDKFSSEIGVLDGEPTMLLTMKKVKKGVSGAVTGMGLTASILGAFIISLSALFVSGALGLSTIQYIGLVAALTFSGFLGSIVDSVLGYYEEQGIGSKYTSNFICAVAGAVFCVIILAL